MKVLAGILLASGLCFPQATESKLAGKRIYLHKNDRGHQEGYDGMRDLLQANAARYGYAFESTGAPLDTDGLDALFSRLYKGPEMPRGENTIDILIFCQGEGDGNMGRGPFPPGVDMAVIARQGQVNAHVRSGGGLLLVHAAGGREISYWGWTFGAKLMADWHQDRAFASARIPGSPGQFSANTPADAALDDETLPGVDSSAAFIRRLFTRPRSAGGYQQPPKQRVKGEWYHFNGGYMFEDGSGGAVANPRHTYPQRRVRGDAGQPDSGISPARIFAVTTFIGSGTSGYYPPGKGRPFAWGREVSRGRFDPGASAENGRFAYYNPGHSGDEFTQAGGWVGDLFLSILRWVARDDRGCTEPSSPNYADLATVDDGSCRPLGPARGAGRVAGAADRLGRVFLDSHGLEVAVAAEGLHAVEVVSPRGLVVFRARGAGARTYRGPGVPRGIYLFRVEADGRRSERRIPVL